MTPRKVRSVDDLGHALRAARKARGLTQGALAKTSGLQAHHISSIETGATKPTAATIFILLAALDLDCVLAPRGTGGTGTGDTPAGIEDIF